MSRPVTRLGALALAVTLALASPPSEAIAPVLMLLIKKIAQQAAKSMIKDALLSGLSGMGCKGIALANALEAFDLRRGPGGLGGMLGGMPKMPAGMAMPSMPAGMSMPTMPLGMAMPNMPAGLGMAMAGGLGQGAIPADIAAKMGAMMPNGGQLPTGMALDPDQMAMMARMQQSMSQPLSPTETLATIDELSDLGFLPKAMQTELKECMLFLPASIPALGMGMGMLKPRIPQLRQARAEMQALSLAEQDEVAAALVQEMKPLSSEERVALLESLDSGFFPPRVSQGVKTGLAAR